MLKSLLPPLALLLLGGSAHATGEFYCCQDPASGRRVCGDTLPDQCRGRAYRILDRGGNVLKEVGPPLTPEQRQQQAEEARLKKLQEEAAKEQRRKDQALLDTYATPEDIDLAQQKAEADVNVTVQDTLKKLELAQKRRKKLDNEAEFYKKQPMPAELAKEIRAVDHDIRTQQELLDLKNKDIEAIRTKYDGDRKRYAELTGRSVKPQPAMRKP